MNNLKTRNFCLILFFGIFLMSCFPSVIIKDESSMSIQEIEKLARIKLPRDLKEVHAYASIGMDSYIILTFSSKQEETESFLKKAGCNHMSRPDSRKLQNFPGFLWWKPNESQNNIGCRIESKNWTTEIKVDVSNPQKHIFYLITSES